MILDSRPEKVVFFDGVCHLCNGSVKFLLKHNKTQSLKFTPLQSKFAQDELEKFGIDNSDLESILFLKNGQIYSESTAAIYLAQELSFPSRLLAAFWIVPRFIRDWVYRIIATNRYSWFGKKDECMIPSPEVSDRFF